MLQQLRQRLRGERNMHLGEPGFLRKLIRPKKLEGLFLFVTARCNSKCRTCFYAEEHQRGEDLTFDEIRRLSQRAPRFDKLWLSGGEPTLRDDLPEIVELFHRQNGAQAVNFPTNGLLGQRAEQMVGRLLESCPGLTIHLNFSVDGLGATHDAIRGVPGAFERVTETMDRLERAHAGHPRLHRNVATVVTPEGLDQLFDLGAWLMSRYTHATQFFETVRGDPRDPSAKVMTRPQLERLHRQVMPLYDAMAHRLFGKLPPGPRHLAKLYFVGVIQLLYRLQELNVEGPTPWGMECTAGKTTLVIDHNGDFRSCEMRPPIGRVQDYDYDIGAIYRSGAMRAEIAAIGGGDRANCWCTHTCWMLSSMKFSPRTLLLEVPRAYLALRRQGLPRFDVAAVDAEAILRRHRAVVAA